MTKRRPRASRASGTGLSQTEWATISKVRVGLSDEICVGLAAIVARELSIVDAAIPTLEIDNLDDQLIEASRGLDFSTLEVRAIELGQENG